MIIGEKYPSGVARKNERTCSPRDSEYLLYRVTGFSLVNKDSVIAEGSDHEAFARGNFGCSRVGISSDGRGDVLEG